LSDNLPAGRKEVLEKYRAALAMKGDAVKGKAVFAKACAACHRIADVGTAVGPDVSDLRTKTPEMILTDVLNPNAAIDSNFVSYTVVTKAGRVLTGLLAEETASSVTLRRADNQTDVVLRRDVDEIASTGQSLMPEGMEQNVTVAEMADLIAFLKGWRLLDAP
jgi:putative heme-binding domain-containing protein